MNQQEYLQYRVYDQIKWFDAKSAFNQKMYKSFRLAEIVAAALIPFLVGYHDRHPVFPFVTGFLGVLIVVLKGMEQLYKYHENWIAYRSTNEAIKREMFLFESGTEPYSQTDAFAKFVQNIEVILSEENKKWKTNFLQKAEPKPNPNP